MKKLLLLLSSITIVFGLEIPKNHLVDSNWLDKNQNEKNLVIIDTREKVDYEKEHIKNAVNYPKNEWNKGTTIEIPKLYNTPTQIEEMAKKAGISKDSIVVFYSAGKEDTDFENAATAMWSLWIYGFENSVILDGGFEKWLSEKRVVSKEVPMIKTSEFEIEKFVNDISSLNDVVNAIYDENIQISDARVAKFFKGEDDRKDLLRHGHIPTAKLTPMIRYLKKENSYYTFISQNETKTTLNNSGYGIELDKPLIVYCNTGQKAKGLWFIAKFMANMKDVKVYDGSMVEYSRTNFPIETGEEF
jgi:thiosulfate/3-mercaptopyruvate sulfurtransferase